MKYQLYPLLFALFLTACSEPPSREFNQLSVPNEAIRHSIDALANESNQHNLVMQQQLQQLQLAISTFASLPTENTLSEAQQQWTETHLHYVTASTMLLESESEKVREQWFQLDAWPILPGFLDSLPDYPDSGIINDITVEISEQIVLEQHGITDPGEVSLGMHALEYFLWGRPLSDFQGNEEAASRRRAIMRLQAGQMLKDYAALIDQQKVLQLRLKQKPESEVLKVLLQTLETQLAISFEEVNLALDAEYAHAYLSTQVWQTISQRLKGIMALLDAPIRLVTLMEPLDAEESALVQENVAALLQDLDSQIRQSEELNRPEVPLRLSMLTHSMQHLLNLASTAQITE